MLSFPERKRKREREREREKSIAWMSSFIHGREIEIITVAREAHLYDVASVREEEIQLLQFDFYYFPFVFPSWPK